uniref:Uncharacterized protein n=1 Tax=Escherichia phage PMBT16 TaxID=3137282 RepID=A0AAU8BV60_9VIRU
MTTVTAIGHTLHWMHTNDCMMDVQPKKLTKLS